MPKLGLRFEDRRTSQTSTRFFEFTDSEWEQLERYLEQVRDLERTEFVQRGYGAKVEVSCRVGAGATWSWNLPPEDSLFALLHRLRPLILEGEPASSFTTFIPLVGQGVFSFNFLSRRSRQL